jgi:hypothetical protein
VSGSAYRTSVQPYTEFGPFITGAAVYAVYPPMPYVVGIPQALGVTSHIIVSAVARTRDTRVFPCSSEGELLSWLPIATVDVCDHAAGLREAGYDLEVVAR